MKRFTLLRFRNFFSSQSLIFDSSGESSFKLDFTKESLKGKGSSNQSRGKGIGSLILLLIFFLFSNFLSAQNIQGIVPVQTPKGGFDVDGNAYANTPTLNKGDWFDSLDPTINGRGLINATTGAKLYPNTYLPVDRYKNQGTDFSIFTSSNKINDNPNTYTWGPGSSPPKNEIQNVGVHFTHGDGINSPTSDLWCLFAGDRWVTNGSSYIDFEFLQNPLTITGTTPDAEGNITSGSGSFTTLGPDGGRTLGDILITIEFTSGGAAANVVINKWTEVPSGSGHFEYVVQPNSNYTGKIFCTNNTAVTSVPFNAYDNVDPADPTKWIYDINQWAEGAANLTALFNPTGAKKCFVISTLFVRTRSSGNSSQSELKDMPAAPIQLNLNLIPKVTVASATKCASDAAVTMTATPEPGPADLYTYSWTGPGGFTATTQSISVSAEGDYIVTITNKETTCTGTGTGHLTVNSVNPGTISGNQTLCAPFDPEAFTSTTPGSGSGIITYQWQISTTNAATGFSNIDGATLETYDAPAVSVVTYFRRVTTSTLNGAICPDNSNVLTVTPNTVNSGEIAGSQTLCVPADPLAFTSTTPGSGGGAITYQWQISTIGCDFGFTDIVDATSAIYDAPTVSVATYFRRVTASTLNGVVCSANSNCLTITPEAIYPGEIAGSQTLCAPFDPVAFTSVTPGSDNGLISYQWESSTTSAATGFSNIDGAALETYDAPAVTVVTWFRRVATSTLNGAICPANSNVLVVTPNAIVPGTISGSQTLCAPFDPAAFTSTTSGSGGGAITYQWQSSTDNITFANITSATSATYDAPAVAVVTYFRRTAISTANGVPCSDNSNVLVVTPNAVNSGEIAGSQTLCVPADPLAFTSTTPGSGGGAITYQWQISTIGCDSDFTDIVDATSAIYDAPTVSGATYFRRVTASTLNGVVCSANSNCLTITPEAIYPGEIAGSQTLCAPFDPVAFTSVTPGSDNGLISYQWQISTTNAATGFSNIDGATLETYDAPAVTVVTWFRRVATSTLNGAICPANSNVLVVTPNAITPGIIAGNQEGCAPFDPIAFTSTTPGSGGGTITYQWQSSTDNITFANIASATSATYDAPAVAVVTYFRRTAISTANGVPCSDNSNVLVVTPIPSIPIVLTCPENTTPAYCGLTVAEANAQIAIDFGNWLDSFSFTGGINPKLTITPANPTPPLFAVGGFVDVTWTVVGDCEQDSCTKRFIVDNACNTVCASVPTNLNCFEDSTGTITVYGNANLQTPVEGGTPPYSFSLYDSSNVLIAGPQASNVFTSLAAGSYRVEVWDALTQLPANDNRCISSNVLITQPDSALDLLALEHTDVTCEGPNTGTITAKFSGGTPPYQLKLDDGALIPDAISGHIFNGVSAGSHTVYVFDSGYSFANGISQGGCTDEESVTIDIIPCAKALCTYTQGYYGNVGGMSCAEGVSYTTYDLINKALMSYPIGTDPETYKMTIGLPGHSVWMTNSAADIDAIIRVLPGGGGSYVLPLADKKLSDITGTSPYLRKGNINNTLLAQTITLGLNLGIDGSLGDFELNLGKFYTAEPDGGCGSDTPKVRECIFNDQTGYFEVINEYKDWSINPKVVNALGVDNTVDGLFALANQALGGISTNGLTLSEIAGAVDEINNAFDGCRIFMGYDVEPLVCAATIEVGTSALAKTATEAGFEAYPIPFKDVLTIKYKFNYTSDVKIEVFNSQGMLMLTQTDAKGYLDKEISLNLNTSSEQEQVYVVKVTTNRGSSVKKVMSSR